MQLVARNAANIAGGGALGFFFVQNSAPNRPDQRHGKEKSLSDSGVAWQMHGRKGIYGRRHGEAGIYQSSKDSNEPASGCDSPIALQEIRMPTQDSWVELN